MNDHCNGIKHYAPLTGHAVSIGSNGCLSKNDSPFGTFRVMKNHCNDIHLYTPLTVHVVSINFNNDKLIKQSLWYFSSYAKSM